MRSRRVFISLSAALALAAGTAVLSQSGASPGAVPKADPKEWIQLFNGKNLDGWKLRGDTKAKSNWTIGKATMNAESPQELAVRDAHIRYRYCRSSAGRCGKASGSAAGYCSRP